MGALLNLLGVENNQVLLRKYELIEADFTYIGGSRHDERGSILGALFRKYPHLLDENPRPPGEIIDSFTLTENFMIHLFGESVDDITWLRIKQPGTYTIHFDLIPNSFSFELHASDEMLHFSEHNPKHDINLEKDENCLLVFEQIPTIIHAGSKICLL